MRDKHYKNKSVRLSEEIWERLLAERKKGEVSWNMLLTELLSRKKNK